MKTTTTSETSNNDYQNTCSELIQDYLNLADKLYRSEALANLAAIVLGIKPDLEDINPLMAKALQDIESYFKPMRILPHYAEEIHRALEQTTTLTEEQQQIYEKIKRLIQSSQEIYLTKNEVLAIHQLLQATKGLNNPQLAEILLSGINEHERIKEAFRKNIVNILKSEYKGDFQYYYNDLTLNKIAVLCDELQSLGSKHFCLGKEDNFEWPDAEIWQALGAGLKGAGIQSLELHLNLRFSDGPLSRVTAEQWQAFYNMLKSSGIHTFKLSGYYLDKLKAEQWQALGRTLKSSGIQILDLSKAELGELTAKQLQAFGAALKDSGIQALDLSGNGLNELTAEQLLAFGAVLKDSGIQALDLSGNGLNELTAEQLRAFGAALQGSRIQTLNLSGSGLNKLTAEQLQAFGVALQGSRIQTLNLSGSGLNKLTAEQWPLFCKALQESNLISLEYGEELSPSRTFDINRILFQNQCHFVLQTLFKNNQQLDAFFAEFAAQGFEVTEMEALIQFLSNSNDPYDKLFAALFLFEEGNNLFSEQKPEDINSRALNAIDLLTEVYDLAPELAEHIKHYLWVKEGLLKETDEASDVLKKLQTLDARPMVDENTYQQFQDYTPVSQYGLFKFKPPQADKDKNDDEKNNKTSKRHTP